MKLALWLLTTVLKRTVHVELVLDGGDRKRSRKAMKTKVLEEHMVARSHYRSKSVERNRKAEET